MSFDGILGQGPAIRLLESALTSGRLASGYLFFGPQGVGKHTTAVAFGRAILCSGRSAGGAACGSCRSCVRTRAGTHPGLLLVGRAEGKTLLSIAQIQALSGELALRPLEGESKVAILDEVEGTSIEGFNALLKTLEEPPPRTTLVLVTSAPESVPETIRSRCQGVRFRPLSREVVLSALAEEELSEKERELVAVLAAGSLGRARRVLSYAIHRTLPGGLDLAPMPAGEAMERAVSWAESVKAQTRQERRERGDAVLRLLLGAIRDALEESAGGPDRDPSAFGRWAATVTEGIERTRLGLDVEGVLRAVSLKLAAR